MPYGIGMLLETVLTGDLIGSRKASDPAQYLDALGGVLASLDARGIASGEMFRGDGFQLRPRAPADAFLCAVTLRAWLIGASPKSERWDARVAIGMGRQTARPAMGEAFVLSGQALDEMTSRSPRLVVRAADPQLALRFELASELASAIIDTWTRIEAGTYYVHLIHGMRDQQRTAEVLGKSRPTVTQALRRAQANVIDRFIVSTSASIKELSSAELSDSSA